MTRIIAGVAKGRALKVPPAVTRPTSDRVREAVFSSLEHRLGSLQGCCVYDLYAGSGAFGLEAMSRGAAAAILVERDRKAVEIIKQNVQTSGLAATVVAADVAQFVQRTPAPVPDVVFVDAPYDVPATTIRDQLATLLQQLPDGEVLVVVERSARDAESAIPLGCTDIDARTVGDTSITYAHWYGYRHDDA